MDASCKTNQPGRRSSLNAHTMAPGGRNSNGDTLVVRRERERVDYRGEPTTYMGRKESKRGAGFAKVVLGKTAGQQQRGAESRQRTQSMASLDSSPLLIQPIHLTCHTMPCLCALPQCSGFSACPCAVAMGGPGSPGCRTRGLRLQPARFHPAPQVFPFHAQSLPGAQWPFLSC